MLRPMAVAALALLALPLLVVPGIVRAETLQVYGAGSLTAAFTDLLRRFPNGADEVRPPEFGPSGLMRERIERGAPVDLFASADMAHPRRLAQAYPGRQVIHFTRNALCALSRPAVGLTTANLLDRLLDPAVRIATSTPGADPGGDYAWAVFGRAEAVRPGAKATLEGKAQVLVGGGDKTPLLVPGKGAVAGVFLAGRADVMLTYCSGVAALKADVPEIVATALPPELAVGPAYGMVLLTPKAVTYRFAAFVMSEEGQAVLARHGFDPVGFVPGGVAPQGLMVQRAGSAPAFLSAARLAGLPVLRQGFPVGSGAERHEAQVGGPLLWEVLVASGAVDPAKPAGQVRGIVRVTGADGYTAAFVLAELSPEFAARPVQLALAIDGAALPPEGLRLIVPGEKRGGRSVRDVIRIDVE